MHSHSIVDFHTKVSCRGATFKGKFLTFCTLSHSGPWRRGWFFSYLEFSMWPEIICGNNVIITKTLHLFGVIFIKTLISTSHINSKFNAVYITCLIFVDNQEIMSQSRNFHTETCFLLKTNLQMSMCLCAWLQINLSTCLNKAL